MKSFGEKATTGQPLPGGCSATRMVLKEECQCWRLASFGELAAVNAVDRSLVGRASSPVTSQFTQVHRCITRERDGQPSQAWSSLEV